MLPPWLILVPVGFALAAFGLAKAAIEAEKKDDATSHAKTDEHGSGRHGRRVDRQSGDGRETDHRPRSVAPKQAKETANVRVVNSDVARNGGAKSRVNRGDKSDAAPGTRQAKSVGEDGEAKKEKAKPQAKSGEPSQPEKGAEKKEA